MVSYAKHKGIYVNIVTNAQLIDAACAAALVSVKLDNIVIAIDGASQESYEKYRIGGQLHKAIEAVEYIVAEKNRKKSALPLVDIQFMPMKHNEAEIGKIKELAAKLRVNGVIIKNLHYLASFPHGPEEIARFLPHNPAYCAYKIEGGLIKWNTFKKDRNFCPMAWNYPVINWDGGVYPCCFVCDSLELGNAFESGFGRVWNSKKFLGLRQAILKNKSLMFPCSECQVNFFSDMITTYYNKI